VTTPQHAHEGAHFDLSTITAELTQDPAYACEGHTARTLIRTADQRVVLIVLDAGHTIREHRARTTASIQTLTGHIRLKLPDRSVDVRAGQLLVLRPDLPHDVHANEPSTFLLTLGWNAKAE